MSKGQLPHWDLSNVYPSVDSPQYDKDLSNLGAKITELENIFVESVDKKSSNSTITELANLIGEILDRFNFIYERYGTMHAYLNSFITTNSRDKAAIKKYSRLEKLGVSIQNLSTRFQQWIGELSPKLEKIIPENKTTLEHAFALKEIAEQSKFLMSKSEEALAAELNLSGAAAWNKLQGTVTSQLSVDFEVDGKVERLPMPSLINLHSHPDENVRRHAYEAEMAAWKTVEEPLAAAINGVKGAAITLNKHRGRTDALHPAIDMARIDRKTLDAMLSAMQESLPVFHRYFKSKARRFGKEKLAWWDVFAPVENSKKTYSWEESRDYVLANFQKFSPDLSNFARRAFDNNWIDAEPRDGKRGGAFCMGVPAVKESRVLCNFDGTIDQISTVAHELGHAFHNDCAFKAQKTEIQQDTPMTLAETASIMCETIVMEAVLEEAKDAGEQLAILESRLINDSQVIVDIYSRFLFEKEVFERRADSELSPDELGEIMEKAQKTAYGDGLDERYLMKYMWTWKPHYYYHGLSFYNFPYAFGLLFATGLYAIYKERGAAFVEDYKDLLSSTGEAKAVELASRFGIDIRTKKFWADSLNVIADRIALYEKL